MNIKTLDRYDNPATLLRIHAPDSYAALTEDERDFLRGCCDFESMEFYVVNDSAVLTVDSVTGDVLGEDDLADFASESVNYAREQA